MTSPAKTSIYSDLKKINAAGWIMATRTEDGGQEMIKPGATLYKIADSGVLGEVAEFDPGPPGKENPPKFKRADLARARVVAILDAAFETETPPMTRAEIMTGAEPSADQIAVAVQCKTLREAAFQSIDDAADAYDYEAAIAALEAELQK